MTHSMTIPWTCEGCGEEGKLTIEYDSREKFEDELKIGLRRDHTAKSQTCMSSSFKLQIPAVISRPHCKIVGFTS